MELNYEVLYRHFPSDKINGIAEAVLSRIDEDELDDVYDAVYQAMDDELIYTDDQWAMIREYCTPHDASFSDAWDMFESDLVNAINDGVLIRKDEEDE